MLSLTPRSLTQCSLRCKLPVRLRRGPGRGAFTPLETENPWDPRWCTPVVNYVVSWDSLTPLVEGLGSTTPVSSWTGGTGGGRHRTRHAPSTKRRVWVGRRGFRHDPSETPTVRDGDGTRGVSGRLRRRDSQTTSVVLS